jgi:hypothetical protein
VSKTHRSVALLPFFITSSRSLICSRAFAFFFFFFFFWIFFGFLIGKMGILMGNKGILIGKIAILISTLSANLADFVNLGQTRKQKTKKTLKKTQKSIKNPQKHPKNTSKTPKNSSKTPKNPQKPPTYEIPGARRLGARKLIDPLFLLPAHALLAVVASGGVRSGSGWVAVVSFDSPGQGGHFGTG